jgi:poly-gamma-glutamate synthase PgsB/CapB
MGPTERDGALALLGTTPRKGTLFTAERDYLNEFAAAWKDGESELRVVEAGEIEAISDDDISGFPYVEHKENVALALKVSEALGVPRQVALRGMWNAQPDFGAMSESEIEFFGRKVMFINGFAANHPESSETLRRISYEKNGQIKRKIMVLNSRSDRPDRSKQLGEAMGLWPKADKYILIGSGVYVLFRKAVASGIEASRFVYAEGMKVDRIFEEIMAASGKSAMVTGIGNIGGPGIELVNYFRNRTKLP